MRPRSLLFQVGPVLLAGFLLAACDEAEQGRVLNYEKGTYLGPQDEELSEQDRNELIQRARLQQGA